MRVFAKLVNLAIIIPALLFSQNVFAANLPSPWVDEVRVGGTSSADVQLEALFSPLLPVAKAYDQNWAWLFSPRPFIGASISLQGKTNQIYAGLAWNLLNFGPFFVEASAGGLVHDQDLFQNYADRPSPLTTRFLFRESIAIGYEINPNWRILAFADHGSDGNLGYRNVSVNHFGLLLGARFGHPTNKPIANSMVSTFDWAGPYAGLSAGMALGKFDFVTPTPTVSSSPHRSVNIAGQVGYNWVLGPIVMGVETDYSVQNLNGAATIGQVEELSGSSLWLATVRTRIGTDIEIPFVSDHSLIYGTGGAAFSSIAKSFCQKAPLQCYVNGDVAGGWNTQKEVRSGWTAGAGIELPLARRVTVKFEYLYVNLGKLSFNNGAVTNEFTFSEQFLRAGMNFKFN
jgi:opacity protein-like surface antigen